MTEARRGDGESCGKLAVSDVYRKKECLEAKNKEGDK